ncbi:MAG: hypothetical protein SFU86_25245 [Pirellulaceae bacterium]|nr:hypothetical protein [Pirellulaceae bacterium]
MGKAKSKFGKGKTKKKLKRRLTTSSVVTITSPSQSVYCLNDGDSITISGDWTDQKPLRMWAWFDRGTQYDPTDPPHNPWDDPADTHEFNANNGGTWTANSILVPPIGNTTPCHVRIWWVGPEDPDLHITTRDFIMEEPGSTSCEIPLHLEAGAAAKQVKKSAKKKKKKS